MHFSRVWSSLALAAVAIAQQSELFECNSQQQPNNLDCRSIIDSAGWRDFNDPKYLCLENTTEDCVTYKDEDNALNCVVSVCTSLRSPHCVTLVRSADCYDLVEDYCILERFSGGVCKDPGGGYELIAYLNPDYIPSTGKRDITTRNITSIGMTRAEVDESAAEGAGSVQTLAIRGPEENFVPSIKGRKPAKRQQEGDNEWRTLALSYGVRRRGRRYLVSTPSPAGSMAMVSTSVDESYTVENSISAGATLEEIFSVETSVSISQMRGQSNTVGESWLIDCSPGQVGILYWYPVWNEYEGVFEPSGTPATFWEPLDGNKGVLDVDCLG